MSTKRRVSRHALPELPSEPDASILPRFVTAQQASAVHARWFGPLSARTMQTIPVERIVVGGITVWPTREFLAWAQRRLDEAPRIAGGRVRSQVARDPLADAAE